MLNSSSQSEIIAQSNLRVVTLGFSDADGFDRILQTQRPNQRAYALVEADDAANIDIVIVNYDLPSALADRDKLLAQKPNLSLVAYSKGPLLDPPPYHIRGLLFAARVFSILDKIPIGEVLSPKPEEPKAFVEPTPPVATPVAPVQPISPAEPVIAQSITSTFVATPAVPVVETKPAVVAPVADKTIDISGSYSALIVDDSLAIQKSIEINLTKVPQIGRIDFADSGEAALAKAEASKYDVIFLDVMMPGIDGYETCTRLRKMPEYKKTPIIMVSGKTSPLDEVKGVMAGCTTYLTKPVQQEAFQKLSIRVLAWLDKQKST